jgi:hypothetical protein
MTEAEWRSCTEPQKMLQLLHERGQANARKLRLFAVACCRRLRELLWDSALDNAIRVAEAFADNRLRKPTLVRAWNKAEQLRPRSLRRQSIKMAVAETVRPEPFMPDYVAESAMFARADLPEKSRSTINRLRREERTAQAHLLRDLVNPFRPAPAIDPAWLAWNDSAVVRMATAIYEERSLPEGTLDAQGLAVLADALEEAGCADEQILSHCRGPGLHVRGCWVLDGLLGKS